MCTVVSSVNREFTSFFLMSMSCVSLSSLLVPARASRSWLKQEGACRGLVSILGQKVSPFTVKKFDVSAGFPGCSLSGWGSLLRIIIVNWWILSNVLFFGLRKLPCDFSSLFCWYGELHSLIWMGKQNLPSWINPTWRVVFFMYCWIWPAWALAERVICNVLLHVTPGGCVVMCSHSSSWSFVSP